MAFTWNYGNEDEIISAEAINEISSAISELSEALELDVTSYLASSENLIESTIGLGLREAIDELDDGNYCRSNNTSDYLTVCSSNDYTVCSTNHTSYYSSSHGSTANSSRYTTVYVTEYVTQNSSYYSSNRSDDGRDNYNDY